MRAVHEAMRNADKPARLLPASWWQLTEEETLNMKDWVKAHEHSDH